MLVKCMQCGKDVEKEPAKIKGNKRWFCSRECTGLHNKNRVVVNCGVCGKEVERQPGQLKRGKSVYCSRACTNASKRTRISKTCDNCGKPIMALPCKSKLYRRSFCSTVCYYEYRVKNNAEYYASLDPVVSLDCSMCGKTFQRKASKLIHENHYCSTKCEHKGIDTREEVECVQCGKPTLRRRKLIDSGQLLFCSNACAKTYFVGANIYNWQGGISFEPYSAEFNKRVKQYVRERDDYTCQECGKTEEKDGRRLSIHHADYDKANSSPDYNLITLCRSCNSKANYNRGFWAEYYLVKLHEMRTAREVA